MPRLSGWILVPVAALALGLVGMGPAPARAQARLSVPRASGFELDSLAAANARDPGDLEAALRYARGLALVNTVLSRRKAGRTT